MSYGFTVFKYSSIALSCLMMVLDKLGYQNFKEGIITLIEDNKISFDIGDVLECKTAILIYFSDECAPDDEI